VSSNLFWRGMLNVEISNYQGREGSTCEGEDG